TPLQAAAAQGANNIIRYLIQEGADVDEPPASRAGGTALQLATMEGYTCTALLLLEHGADVNAAPSLLEGRTAFGAAADNGRIEMMLLLVQNGVDLLSNDGTQYTRALDFAEKAGQIAARDLVQQLYE
ncbi:ankyrin, partial [Mytilinidion resinicola]